jgi:hypothetical protein
MENRQEELAQLMDSQERRIHELEVGEKENRMDENNKIDENRMREQLADLENIILELNKAIVERDSEVNRIKMERDEHYQIKTERT